MAKEFNPTDWADVLALDLISIALSNPYKTSLDLIAAHLRVVEQRGFLLGMEKTQTNQMMPRRTSTHAPTVLSTMGA